MERIGCPRFTREQKAELWERWKTGESPSDIARALERRTKGGVYRILASTGGPGHAEPDPSAVLQCR